MVVCLNKELPMKARLSGVSMVVGAFLVAGTALLVARTMWAADSADSGLKCPVSGHPASKDHAVDFDGGKVYFCCDNCPKAFAANPTKFAAKAHLQMLETGQLTQTACPLTGKPVNAEMTVEIDGQKVALCCANCKKKISGMTPDKQVQALFGDISKGFKLAEKK